MIPPEFDGESVVSACLAGDLAAWGRMVDRYTAMIWGIAREHRLAAFDCYDVCQSTWTNVFLNLGKLRSAEGLTGWIATTARRESLKCVQRNSKFLPTDDVAALDSRHPEVERPDEIVVRKLMAEHVRAAFRLLPARDQLLLGMLMSDNPPNYDTLSERLGVPRGSIGPFRRRALTRLRRLLAEACDDDAP